MSTAALLVPTPALPAMPLVMADTAFLAHLTTTEDAIKALTVVDGPTVDMASKLLNELTTAGARLEGVRLQLKRPFLDINSRIDECAKIPTARIDAMKRVLKISIAGYVERMKKEAAAAEAARQAEIRRPEAEKAKADAEAKAKADAIVAAAKANDEVALDFEDDAPAPKTELELKLEAVKFAPAIVAPAAPVGVRFQTRLVFQVTDLMKLPETFVVRKANDMLIRSTYCVGFKDGDAIPEVPGVKFTVDRTPISTGKTPEVF